MLVAEGVASLVSVGGNKGSIVALFSIPTDKHFHSLDLDMALLQIVLFDESHFGVECLGSVGEGIEVLGAELRHLLIFLLGIHV